jgi:hypothetical protein
MLFFPYTNLPVTYFIVPHLIEYKANPAVINSIGAFAMKINESGMDRIIRVIVGIVLLALYFAGTVTGGLGIVFIVLGAVALITGVVGFCPLYTLLKISTKKA